jgi:hypothetical protein
VKEGTTPTANNQIQTKMKSSKKAKSLETALAIIEKMEWVAGVTIWTPTAEEVDEYKADGLEARRQLEVVVYKSHRNATDIKIDIEGLGLECVSEGSACEGPCYGFVLTA